MKNVISDINSNNYKNFYLFTGEEIFLQEYYANSMITNLIEDKNDSFNYMSISRDKTDVMEIDSFVNSYPFMKDKKVLIVKNTGILKKATDEEKKYFTSLLPAIPEYMVIIFIENEIDKRNAIYKAIEKSGYIAEFPIQKGSSLITWVQKIMKTYGKEIDSDTAQYLIDSCNMGMIYIKREIEKIGMCKKDNPRILKSDIDALATKSIESKVFEMAEDIAGGNLKSAHEKLDNMKKLNVKSADILPAIFSKFSTYRKIKVLSDCSSYEIATRTKQREYFVKKDLQILKNISLKNIDNILKLCQEADYKIKSGQSDGWTEISLMFIK